MKLEFQLRVNSVGVNVKQVKVAHAALLLKEACQS